jgi:hypothetical protein
MKVIQISVFLENKPGRLAEVTRTLADHEINLRALCIAETIDFGVLRLIVNDPQRAKQVLTDGGWTLSETEVLVVQIPDRPGGLNYAIQRLAEHGLNVEYVYAFVTHSGESADVVFRLDQLDEAIQVFQKEGIRILSGEEVYRL